jgi:hypothetical protein
MLAIVSAFSLQEEKTPVTTRASMMIKNFFEEFISLLIR